ncbi:glycogen/starch synthase [Candidatus Woesearchaeota archaeon]|nr:glycogen/starch synthase [Candidatus Woesearchaeota archaeon]
MNSFADIVFEVSWEITNKCGGIYTVITSKINLMRAHYDHYTLVGPLFDELPADFTQTTPPEPIARAFSALAHQGVRCVYGTWDVEGRPNTILVDARSLQRDANEIKTRLWLDFGVESYAAGHDFTEPLVWSWGVGMLLEQFQKEFPSKKIVSHFHEWLSGFGVLYLKKNNVPIAKVFTTHATMLGRSMASRGKDYFNQIGDINPLLEAKKLGVVEKFSTERACALAADVFTTVSKTTAREAEILFGRKPDITPNGLALDLFPTFEEASYNHRVNKIKLQEFVMSHFFPYQIFDLSETLFYYSSGRYEFENKGLDITIDALGRLNHQLREEGSTKTIVMFFLVAMGGSSPKQELLENKSHLEGLSSDIEDKEDYFLQRIILQVMLGDKQKIDVVPEHFITELRRKFRYVKRSGNPFLVTHNINEPADPIVKRCMEAQLYNNSDDRVKVVFVPAYLSGQDGLLNMEYYQVVSGCHLGIFPSFYEPWGYTPLESLALGVPAVTSNTAGFGQHMEDKPLGKRKGLYIINRTVSREKEVDQLYSVLSMFAAHDLPARVACKLNGHALATFADWRQLIRYYICAHNKALGKPGSNEECEF